MSDHFHLRIILVTLLAYFCLGAPERLEEKATYPEITNFHQVSETETTVTVEWSLDITTYQPLKYRLTVNNLISNEFFCTTTTCSRTVSGLSPCDQFDLSLVAVFALKEETNTPQTITAYTEFSTPGAISNLADDGVQITWDAPQNANCVSQYRVCYTSDFFISTTCVNVTGTYWVYSTDLSGCDSISITVEGTTADGKIGPSSGIDVITAYGLPSEPTNYEVSFISDTEVLLKWDLPTANAACIKEFATIFGPDTSNIIKIPHVTKVKTQRANQQYQSTISGLNFCTYYKIQVLALSIQDDSGPAAVDYKQTVDNAPGEIPEIQLEPGEHDVTIKWGNGTADACLGSIRICYSDYENGQLYCEQTNPDGNPNGEYTISGLSACTSYPFIIQGISPGGKNGSITVNSTVTEDVAPGPVRSLAVSTRSSSSLGVDWDAPLLNSQCVDQYVISYTNMEENVTRTRDSIPKGKSEFEDILTGLDPCVTYLVSVYAVSAGGKKSAVESTIGDTSSLVPSAPRNLQTLSATRDSATFLWYAPMERYCVDLYHMAFISVGSEPNVNINYEGSNTHAEQYIYTFQSDDLVPCTTYDLQLDAHGGGSISPDALGQVTLAC